MRRYLYLILFFVVLVLPFAVRGVLRIERDEATGDEGGRLVIVTPHNQDIRREFARAFDQWHRRKYGQGIAIDYRTPGGTNDIKRLLETSYRPYVTEDGTILPDVPVGVDIVWGGGDYFFDQELKRLFERNGKRISILQPLELDAQLLREAFPEPTLAGVKLYDFAKDTSGDPLPPQWVGVCLSSFGIVYNPDLYAAMQLSPPGRWRDLAVEQLAGKVALADPTHSGSAAVAYLMVMQRAMADAEEDYLKQRGPTTGPVDKSTAGYRAAIAAGWKRGMGELLLIAANARYFTDSASQVNNDVASGEAAAGMAIDFYGRVTEETVGSNRIRFVSPPAETAITPDPVAILHGVSGERKRLANHFVEFLLSREGQLLWQLKPAEPGGPRERALRRPPVRRDVYADQRGWSDLVNPFTEAGGFNQRAEWMGLFGDLRPLWAAAWIDSRDDLKDAYRAVLRVPDGRQRAELIARLADLPIEMSQVEQLREERRKRERMPEDIEQWKAQQRIEWARRFREHYGQVAHEAEP